MSEPQEPAAPSPTPPAPEPQPAQAAEPDWKAEARKWEARAKENHGRVQELQPLADQFRQLEEASKSELQRLQEAHEAATRARDEAASEALRLRVALKHGISADDFDLLGSGDEEQIEARAQRIAEKNKAVAEAMQALATPPPGSPTPRRPGEQLKPGATPAAPPQLADEDYPAEWLSPSQRARVQQAREQYQ